MRSGDAVRSGRRAAARRPLALVSATASVITVGLLVALTPGAQAATDAPAAPAAVESTTVGSATLAVDPSGGLDPDGSTITVTGSGFDATSTVYVAVCAADGKAPASLAECMGGAVPDGNKTKAWGYITAKGTAAPGGGGVAAAWGDKGSFSVQLTLPGAAASAVDCLHAACSVFATAGGAAGPALPITFAAETTTTSSTTSTTTTTTTTSTSTSTSTSTVPSTVSSSTAPPSTVSPKAIATSVQVGAQQQVLFAGFRPGEKVLVTLFSEPQTLPSVTADSDGIVTIDFVVPSTLAPGTHLIQAIGQTSKNVGIGSFTVLAVPSSPSAASSVASSTPPSSTAPSTEPSTASSVEATSSAPASVASSASSAAVVTPVTPADTSKPTWPWFVLGLIGLLVVIGAVIGLVALSRRRRLLAEEEADRDRQLAMAAAEEHHRALIAQDDAQAGAPTTYIPPVVPPPLVPPGSERVVPPGYQPNEHGLLSGQSDIPPTAYPPQMYGATGGTTGAPAPEASADDTRTRRIDRPVAPAPEEDARTRRISGSAPAQPPDEDGRTRRISGPPSSPAPDEDARTRRVGAHETGEDPGEATQMWTPPDDDEDDDPRPRGRHGR